MISAGSSESLKTRTSLWEALSLQAVLEMGTSRRVESLLISPYARTHRILSQERLVIETHRSPSDAH